jgi:hypothetical protein
MATNYYKREPFGTPKTNHKMGFHYFLMTHDHKKKMEMMVSVLYMIHIPYKEDPSGRSGFSSLRACLAVWLWVLFK